MAYPTSPTNGQIYKNKRWNSTKLVWEFALDSNNIASSTVVRDSNGNFSAGAVAPAVLTSALQKPVIIGPNINADSNGWNPTAGVDSGTLYITSNRVAGSTGIDFIARTNSAYIGSYFWHWSDYATTTTNLLMSLDRLGQLSVKSNITSSNSATGSLVVAGGAGIGGALNVGGNINASVLSVSGGQALNYPNTGYGITGAVHFTGAVNGQSQGITWTANGQTQAGLLVHNDNGIGTTMRLLTTESYTTGPQTALTVANTGNVTIERGSIIFPNKGFGSMKIGNETGMLSGYPTQNYNVIKSEESIYFDSANKYVLAIDGDGGYTHFWRGTSTTGFFLHGSTGNTTGVMSNLSDRNLKKDISELTGALDLILKLKPTNYQWKEPEKYGSGVKQGFIAQEVETIKSDWVIEMGEYKALQLQGLDAYLVKAIQEISARLTILENK